MPKKIATIDCESDPFDGHTFVKPFIWGFYNGDVYESFDDTKEFAKFLSMQKNTIAYAHNGGKFDWHFMLDYMNPLQNLMIINGRLSKFYIGDCECRDSYNILPIPLAAWNKTKFDYRKLHKDVRHLHMDEIRKYLKDDCYDLYEVVNEFIDRFGMNLTLAGTAMKVWQRMSDIKAPKSDSDYYDFLKCYYYGGRTQAFEVGYKKVPFKMIDINSAYPRAMIDKHPISTEFVEHRNLNKKEVLKLLKTDEGKAGFYTVIGSAYGCFPYRAITGDLFFPNDNEVRTYHVTGWELLAALETDTCSISEYVCAYLFIELIDFKNYVMHFYKLKSKGKETGNKADELFSKLMLNSLYGKFAASPSNYQKYKNVEPEHSGAIGQPMTEQLLNILGMENIKEIKKYDLSNWYMGGMLGKWHLAVRDLEEYEQNFYNIATSASITGWVRAYMWRTICQCDTPLYCDTDSIAALGLSDEIPMGKELGEWDIDGEFTDYSIGGKKMYAFKFTKEYIKKDADGKDITHKIASKGVRLNASELHEIALGSEVTFTPQAPSYSIHKQPVFVSRNVRATHKTITEVEKLEKERKMKEVEKNIKRLKTV
jgi:hypothetical protein